MCDPGYYCPQGSSSMLACPNNTYNDKTGASSESFCLPCPENKVCSGTAVKEPASECPGGYYCVTVNKVLN